MTKNQYVYLNAIAATVDNKDVRHFRNGSQTDFVNTEDAWDYLERNHMDVGVLTREEEQELEDGYVKFIDREIGHGHYETLVRITAKGRKALDSITLVVD